MSQIPDDRAYYSAEDEWCSGDDWERCPCEDCQNTRDARADELYQRRRDEEFDK